MTKDVLFDFDHRKIDKLFRGLEKEVLPNSQVNFLNTLAFGARKSLLKYADKEIQGKPTSWTKRGFMVEKAEVKDGQDIASSVYLQPSQAAYMKYLIEGGTRKAGDIGATKYDVLTDASEDQKTSYGNIKKGYLRRVARKARSEKLRRAKAAIRREKLRARGKSTAPARWKTINKSKSEGIFFGKVGGIKGYWERMPKNKRLQLLIRFSDRAKYRPTFKWNDEILKSIEIQNPKKIYDKELNRALKKLKL